MHRLFIFLIVLLPFKGATQLNTDSLRAVIGSDRPYEQQINASIKLVENLQLKDFDSVLIEGNKALRLARKHTDSTSVADVKRQLGIAGYLKGRYDIASRYFLESIAILENKKDKKRLAPVYSDLAKLYRKTSDPENALSNFNKADALFRSLKDSSGMAMVLNESGAIFQDKADYREAIKRYTESMKLAEAAGDSLSVSYSLSNIAAVFVIEKKFELAEINLLRALSIRQLLKDSFAIALTYSDLGVAMNGKGDYIKAVEYLTMSNEVAAQLKYPELQSNNYTELASVAQKQGDFQKAFEYFIKRSSLRDSLYTLEKTKQIEELNARFENARREQQILRQQGKLRTQNYLFIGIGVLSLMMIMLVHSQYRRYKLRKEAQLQKEIMRQQENAIRAVMEAEEKERQRIAKDLHDGIGQMMSAAKMNLSALESDLTFLNDDQKKSFDKAIDLVDESCRELRTVSHIMMPGALMKNNLSTAIHDFVDKLPQKDIAIHVSATGLEERFDANVETVLYRVIQECVHNALKHAGATSLDISFTRDKDGISGTIEDNGRGFDKNEQLSSGIGIRNIISRIGYLKGTVDFDSSPGRGTVVAIHIPIVDEAGIR